MDQPRHGRETHPGEPPVPIPTTPQAAALILSAMADHAPAVARPCDCAAADAYANCPGPDDMAGLIEFHARRIFEGCMDAAAQGAKDVIARTVFADAPLLPPEGVSFTVNLAYEVNGKPKHGPLTAWFLKAQAQGHFKPRFS